MVKKLVFVVFIVILGGLLWWSQSNDLLNFQTIKERKDELVGIFQSNPILYGILFFVVYVVVTSLSLPIASLMTLMAGLLFGTIIGSIIVSFASSMGATFSFLLARFFFQDALNQKYPDMLAKINRGMEKEGWSYLLSLRLIPIIPFFVVNLLMGLTKLRVLVFFIVSQIGMLPATVIYVNAGTAIGTLESPKDILKPEVWASLLALALLPFIIKFVMRRFKKGEST